MSQIAAIALLALRNVVRSRVILVLSALLFAATFLLPIAIQGDGSPESLIRIHLSYSLGIAAFLLALATLWSGCAAISQEADDKTLQLLLVKPVSRLRIWLGKWLALLVLNALLLALIGSIAGATLHHKLRRGGFAPGDLARARQTTLASLADLRAPLPDVEASVRAEYEQLQTRGGIPDNVSESIALDSIRRSQLARLYSIPPRASRTWNFGSVGALSKTLLVQFKCDSSVPGAADVRATVELDLNGQKCSREIQAMPGTVQTLVFDNLSAPPGGSSSVAVSFSNHGIHNATLFFDPAEGLILREPRGSFVGNFLRALAQLYFRLALFAAIGVALGTLFSMPVATFLALVLIAILQLSGFVSAAAQVDRATFVANVAPFGADAHAPGGEGRAAPSLAARAAATVLFYTYRGTYLTLRPLLEDRTIDDFAAGTYIPPRAVARNFLQQALLLPLILALLATAVLRRREWALPSIN